MIAAELHDVSRRYGRHWALARVSLAIPAGQIWLLTGSNGAGKTTLLRILGTALKPTFGTLDLFGEPSANRHGHLCRRVGLLTHTSFLYEDLTAEENLALTARFATGVQAGRIGEILARVGLASRKKCMVREYSAGMRRRLCLGRILLREPDLVLLDEPFGQLDPAGVELTEELVGELATAGKTIVISTHDIERGKRLCDHHVHMRGGRLLRPPEALPNP